MVLESRFQRGKAYGGYWQDSPLSIWQRLDSVAKRYPERFALASLRSPPIYTDYKVEESAIHKFHVSGLVRLVPIYLPDYSSIAWKPAHRS